MTFLTRTTVGFWRRVNALALAVSIGSVAAHAVPPQARAEHWVGTWATSPLAAKNPGGKFGTGAGGGSTLREVVHVSLGGTSIRVLFTNEFGLDPLTIAAAQVALSSSDSSVVAGSAAGLSFGGKESITIPPGAMVVSDPATIKVPAMTNLAVSLFLPEQPVSQLSLHPFADTTNYLVAGNAVAATSLDTPTKIYSWDFLKGIDVQAPSDAAAIVTFGDSITDGAHSTRDANLRWPDVLARRLLGAKGTANLGILNEGIGGNRVVHDVAGPNALARLDRDVLAQAGVKYLVVLEGINDIGRTAMPNSPDDGTSADAIIQGLGQIITRAHAHGIKVIGATLTPFEGAKYASPDGEKMRAAVNEFVRHSGKFDAVIDFDKATRDPAHPTVFLPAYDSGDHLHPGDAGYKAMGDAIDLKIFSK